MSTLVAVAVERDGSFDTTKFICTKSPVRVGVDCVEIKIGRKRDTESGFATIVIRFGGLVAPSLNVN